MMRSLADAPGDAGWLLLSTRIIGEIVLGVIGTPCWVMGTLILWFPMGVSLGQPGGLWLLRPNI